MMDQAHRNALQVVVVVCWLVKKIPGGLGLLFKQEERWSLQLHPTMEVPIMIFSVWNQGVGGSCPTGASLGSPTRCNYAAPQSPTGIRGTGNGNSNGASGNLFSNNMTVTAGQVIYILVDNWDGTNVGFRLDFFWRRTRFWYRNYCSVQLLQCKYLHYLHRS
jgi:hypothetical protein